MLAWDFREYPHIMNHHVMRGRQGGHQDDQGETQREISNIFPTPCMKRDNFPCSLLSEMNCMTAADAPYLAWTINYCVLTAKIIRISGQESCLVNKISWPK